MNHDRSRVQLDTWLDFLISAETMKYFYNIKPFQLIKVQCQNSKVLLLAQTPQLWQKWSTFYLLALNSLRFLKSDACNLICSVCYISAVDVATFQSAGRSICCDLPRLQSPPYTHTFDCGLSTWNADLTSMLLCKPLSQVRNFQGECIRWLKTQVGYLAPGTLSDLPNTTQGLFNLPKSLSALRPQLLHL